MKKMVSFLAAIGALGMTAFPEVARADPADTKVGMATSCKKLGTTGTLSFNYGRIRNTSTSEVLYVNCPLLIDSVWDLYGAVIVRDYHASSNISCMLSTVTYSGTTLVLQSSPISTSSGSAGSAVGLNFSGQHSYFPYRFITCGLPPSTGTPSVLSAFAYLEGAFDDDEW